MGPYKNSESALGACVCAGDVILFKIIRSCIIHGHMARAREHAFLLLELDGLDERLHSMCVKKSKGKKSSGQDSGAHFHRTIKLNHIGP